ncbi:Hypothetical protein FKW44_013134, partial [Caligus rogercresseyi]
MSSNLSAGRPLLWRSVAAVRPRRSSTSSNSPKLLVYSIAKSFKESEDIEEGIPNTGREDSRPSQGQNINKEVYLDVLQTVVESP